MDIKTQFDSILSEIEAKKRELVLLSDKAKADFLDAESEKIRAEKAKKEAGEEIEKLSEYKKTQELVEDLSVTESELKQMKLDLAERANKLVRWENALVEIEARQKLKESDLVKREAQLVDEKKVFKEKLKKEFFDQLNKQIS